MFEVCTDPTITVTVEDPTTDLDHEIFITTVTGDTISRLIDYPPEGPRGGIHEWLHFIALGYAPYFDEFNRTLKT